MQYMFETRSLTFKSLVSCSILGRCRMLHEERSCHFGSLSVLPRADGDLLRCEDIGSEHDSMLSLRLIVRNFPSAARRATLPRERPQALRLHMRPSSARRQPQNLGFEAGFPTGSQLSCGGGKTRRLIPSAGTDLSSAAQGGKKVFRKATPSVSRTSGSNPLSSSAESRTIGAAVGRRFRCSRAPARPRSADSNRSTRPPVRKPGRPS